MRNAAKRGSVHDTLAGPVATAEPAYDRPLVSALKVCLPTTRLVSSPSPLTSPFSLLIRPSLSCLPSQSKALRKNIIPPETDPYLLFCSFR